MLTLVNLSYHKHMFITDEQAVTAHTPREKLYKHFTYYAYKIFTTNLCSPHTFAFA